MLAQDEELKSNYLPGLASGETVGTLAVAEHSGSWDLTTPRRRHSSTATAGRC